MEAPWGRERNLCMVAILKRHCPTPPLSKTIPEERLTDNFAV